ncbi:imidazoleglycerol-phosphate dehydratase [Hydrogenispora ethanolica]|jgi:imidazoleglycerol-phosphate dehydratase|uniref:Imidazoleglycerol-phosphate dehydratase n=1 Tax=Hydrogenispora ethanolica TaxID=1082276 RepID=A0A4R1REC9_HYDET|nr:imidazoleglycerol-phosphate dehydratase HisB [Hydrogenispora ethanolica]TCL64268.1 imidazoleglycerol-phosphate dehydratase [Hydrogenispora ethanolica]
MRTAVMERNTLETKVQIEINLDGTGTYEIETGIGFFDHMLAQIARHGRLDLKVHAAGDLEVDSHHTVEDVGIVLGQALQRALGEKQKICRYGEAIVPMDEALSLVAIDLSGRPFLRFRADLGKTRLGQFDLEMVEEFFRAVSVQAGMNIHIQLMDGSNLHHCCEAIFKAFGRALAGAVSIDERMVGIPSTKGVL